MFLQNADFEVAVEFLDLAVFHIPQVGSPNVDLGSVSFDGTRGRFECPSEGAPERHLNRDKVPYRVNPEDLSVNVRNELV